MLYNIALPREYGYVLLAASSTVALNFMQIIKIGRMRKRLDIKYPVMYSEKHPEFNCAQRVHQNTLEILPFYYINLLIGGIRHPCAAAGMGAVFLLGRILFSLGYWTGKPEKRVPGAIMSNLTCFFGLTGLAVSTAAGFLGWW